MKLVNRAIRLLIFTCTLLGGSISPLTSSGQTFYFVNGIKNQTIHFQLIKNLIIIPVSINGKGPFNFVLDTGIGIMLITDPSLADSLKFNGMRHLRISGFGEGSELTASITPRIEVTIGNKIWGETTAAVLEKDAFNLSAYAGIPVYGLIGYDFFSSFTVRINYSSGLLKLYSPYTHYVFRRGYRIPLDIEEKKPYFTAQVSTTAGKLSDVKLIIDTGAGHPISLETDSGKPYTVPEPNIRANLGVGLQGAINGYISRIPFIKMGKYQLNSVIAAFPDYNDAAGKITDVNRNGNVGNAILSRFHVVFDYSNKCMYLRPNLKFRDAFEHDMSGIELEQSPPEYKHLYISRIEPGSPAEEAGLEENDEILEINFKPVSEMGMENIYDLFRSGNKRNFLLRILPQGESKTQLVVLTLKRRI